MPVEDATSLRQRRHETSWTCLRAYLCFDVRKSKSFAVGNKLSTWVASVDCLHGSTHLDSELCFDQATTSSIENHFEPSCVFLIRRIDFARAELTSNSAKSLMTILTGILFPIASLVFS